MKLIFALLSFLFLLYACQKDELNPPENGSETKISEKIIGPEGGIISTDSIEIFIPTGAFSSEKILELWTTDNNPEGEIHVSSSYILKGVPYDFTLPIKIGIKYNRDLENKSFISASHKQIYQETSQEELISERWPASDSANYLWGFLQPLIFDGAKKKTLSSDEPGSLDYHIYAISSLDTYETEFAKITYFVNQDLQRIKLLGDRIDSAAQYFISRNLFSDNNRINKINIEVISITGESREIIYNKLFNRKIDDLKPSEWINRSIHLTNHTFVNIDIDKFNNYDERFIRMIAGESVYRFIQSIYVGYSYNWLDWALLYHFKRIFMEDDTRWEELYYKSEYYEQPFIGLESGMKSLNKVWDLPSVSPQQMGHGVAMAPLLDYLLNLYKPEGELLLKIFEEIIKNPDDPLGNLLNAIPTELDVWWPGFLRTYINDELLKSATKICIENINYDEEFYFMDDSDTLKNFKKIYNGISGDLCRLNFSLDGFKEGESLRFTYSAQPPSLANVKIIVFSIKDGKLEYLTEGTDILITDIKSLTDNGIKSLAVLVTNSIIYENEYAQCYIDLEIRREIKKSSGWPWKYVNVNFENITGIYDLNNGEEYETTASFSHDIQNCIFSADESAFYSSWDTSYTNGMTGYSKRVDLYIKVDTLNFDVLSFEVEYLSEYYYDGVLTTRQLSSITGGRVPASVYDSDYLTGQMDGSNACGVVQTFEHTYTSDPGTDYEKTMVLKSYSCSEDSYLRISWKKEKLIW